MPSLFGRIMSQAKENAPGTPVTPAKSNGKKATAKPKNGVEDDGKGAPEGAPVDALLDEVEQKMLSLGRQIKEYTQGTGDEVALAKEVRAKLDTILHLDRLPTGAQSSAPEYVAAVHYIRTAVGDNEQTWGALLTWLFTHPLGKLVTATDFAGQSRSWVDEWLLRKIIAGTLQQIGRRRGGSGARRRAGKRA